MSDDIINAMQISAMGMKAQGARIRVASENLANADTAATTPGGDPYTRQVISFENRLDRELGIRMVDVKDITDDKPDAYPTRYMPDHPGADENGIVKLPNVNTLVEMMNVREAQRSYEANLGMIEQSKTMVTRTIDLLR